MEKIKKLKFEIYAFGLFVLSRLPALGYEMFNTDVWKWKQRIYDFGTGVFTLDFEKTIQMYHPGVSLMWLGSFAVKVFNFSYRIFTGSNPPDNNIDALFLLHFTQKLFIVLFIALLVALIFYIVKKLFGLKYAGIVLALLIFEPFYVALTRVVHLEGLQSSIMLASFITLYMYVNKPSQKKWLVLSAVLGAFATLTKSSAVFMLPFAAFLLFFHSLLSKKGIPATLKFAIPNFLVWVLVAVASYFVLWPAMWVRPDLAIQEVLKGVLDVGIDDGHYQLFLGQWTYDPGPTFYWYTFILRSSLYLVTGLVGSIFIFKKLNSEQKKFAFFALAYAILYTIEVAIPSKKLDRYLLPAMLSLVLFVAFFFEHATNFISTKLKLKFRYAAAIIFLPAAITLATLHPDYFSYYSILGGGLKNGIWKIEPKWVIGQHELMKYIKEKRIEHGWPAFQEGESLQHAFDNLDNRMIVAFPEKYYTQLHPLVRKVGGGWATIVSIKPDAKNAEYIIFPVWFDPTDEKDPWEFVEQVYLRGVPIYNVYRNTNRFGW